MPHRLISRESLILALGIWTIYALLEISISGSVDPLTMMWAACGLCLTLILGVVLGPVLSIRHSIARYAAATAMAVTFAVIQTTADLAILFAFDHYAENFNSPPGIELSATNYAFQTAVKLTFKFYIWLFGFYVAILALVSATREKWRARVEAQRAQIEALRLQINPHFLFNAFSAMDGLLALQRTGDAARMLHGLSDFYRSTLMGGDDRLIPLAEELAILQDYAAVEQVRFGDRLRLQIDGTDAAEGAAIPPLLLQPVIENAIKYGDDGVSPFVVTVAIARAADMVHVTVTNPIPASPARPGAGTGLINVRNRLALAYRGQAALEAGPDGDAWRVDIRWAATAV